MAEIIWHETKMTSNTTPSPLVVTASSVYSTSHEPFNAFNGLKDDIVWLSAEGSHINSWIKIDFGEVKPINKVSLTPRSTTNISQTPKDFYIESSVDNINWTTIGTFSVTNWVGLTSQEFDLEKTTAQYLRITHTTVSGGTRASWSEIQYGFLPNDNKIVVKNSTTLQHYSLSDNTLIHLPSSSSKNMILHGLEQGKEVQLDVPFDKMKFVDETSEVLGVGKTYTHSIDMAKVKVNKLIL